VISIIAYVALVRIANSFAEVGRLGEAVTNAQEIDQSFLAFRRYAIEFALTGDERSAVAAQKIRGPLKDHLNKGIAVTLNSDRRTKLIHAAEQFEAYAKDFDKVGVLRREQDKLTKDILDPTGLKLRTEMEQLQSWAAGKANNSNTMLVAGEALKHLMLARLSVNKLLGRHDEAAAQSADKAFADMKTTMAALGAAIGNDEVRKLFSEVTANVEKYFDAYKKAAHDAHEIETLVHGEMRQLAQSIAEDMAAIKEASVAAEHTIETETEGLITNIEHFILILAIGGLGLGALLAWLIGRAIANPIKGMTGTMTALAGGDLQVDVPALGTKDEIGEMAKAVLVFRDAAVDKVRMEREAEEERVRSEAARKKAEEEAIGRERAMVSASIGAGMAKLAAKDLTFRLTDDLPEAYRKLQADFNSAIEQLEIALQSVRNSTHVMHSGTQEISTASNDLSRRTEQQASSLEETAAALDEITATVRKTAESAAQARDIVSTAKANAEKSGEVVRKAVEAMGGIEKSSQQISQIIGVIDEIAFQTNLLALNAGVEAARAGDAGRGFAVVASEVRALAQRSAEAAKEIKGLISASTTQVGQGVSLVADTGKSLEQIVGQVTEINASVSNIAASAQEQATGLQQVNTAINQMDQVTQQNAAMAEEATAAAKSLGQESSQLGNLIGKFHIGNTDAAEPMRREVQRFASPKPKARTAERKPVPTNGVRKPETAHAQEEWKEF
jgi:methyl-accepting chemotaxis protein